MAPAPPTPAIKWERSFEEAQKKARKSGKPIIVDFWAEWCGWCDRLNRTTYVDPDVVRRAQDFVAVKIDTEGSSKEREIAASYEVSLAADDRCSSRPRAASCGASTASRAATSSRSRCRRRSRSLAA